MARLKPSIYEERRRITRACITANQERYGYTDEQLAKLLSQTSHIKNGIRTLKNQYFSL